jgi:L-threonylcarbamoyladenylate synthase
MNAKLPHLATRVLPVDANAIAQAGELLRQGGLVAFPTETVYGLGANGLDDLAVSRIFAAKGRPTFNPLIMHVLDHEQARELVNFNPLASVLAEAFWPGGLTLVLPRRDPSRLALLVSAGLDTAAVRAPAHATARALLHAAGVPIAAPSANRAGAVSPTTAQHVAEELGGGVDLILDAGPCTIGLESTIVGFDHGQPVLLRPGAVAREAIQHLIGPLSESAGERIEAPGMMASHYAPRARLRLNATAVSAGEALLAFGAPVPEGASTTSNLSPNGDLVEAAANLYSMLRALDKSGAPAIAVMPVPEHGLGEAINDRLGRAAAPRGNV